MECFRLVPFVPRLGVVRRSFLITVCSIVRLSGLRLLASGQFKRGATMAFELTGTVKYARRMKGTAKGSGKPYDFFSLIVLDTDEGERIPLQMSSDNPQFEELCQRDQKMVDQPIKVVIRRCLPGVKKNKDTGKDEPTVRFFIKKVLFQAAPQATGR